MNKQPPNENEDLSPFTGLTKTLLEHRFRNQDEFQKSYFGEFSSYSLLSWLEDFADQLDCPPPDPFPSNQTEYFKRVGAWETQMIILKKLRYAITVEKNGRNK